MSILKKMIFGRKKNFFPKIFDPSKKIFFGQKKFFLVSYCFYGHFRLWKAFKSHIYRFFGINMIKKGLNEPIINITIHMSTVLLNRESTIGRFWNTTASPPGLSHCAGGPLRGPPGNHPETDWTVSDGFQICFGW